MRIVDSEVALASSRVATSHDFTRTTAQAWIGQRPANAPITTVTNGLGRNAQSVAAGMPIAAALRTLSPAATSSVSEQARRALQDVRGQLSALAASVEASAAAQSSAVSGADGEDPLSNDPELQMLQYLIEALTGKKVKVLDPRQFNRNPDAAARAAAAQANAARAAQGNQDNAAAQPAGWGVEVRVEQVHQESETTGYEATGRVVTADGASINFDFALVMQRDESLTTTTEVLAGDAVRKVDPIAIKLGTGPVALADTRTAFDIDSDGATENVALPAAGTYFVALDRDGNGRVDNGGELFGPTTGNGFTELAKLDGDGNGWIDEGDAAYANLRLWSGPANETMSLAEAGVGALYVGASTATQFELKSASNRELGQIRSSSVYLTEGGQAGAMAQVDLTA